VFVNSNTVKLILRKISKTDATRRQILRLKCTKICFPLHEALPQIPLPIAFLFLKGEEDDGRGVERDREGNVKAKEGERAEDLAHPKILAWHPCD